jgi:hypothetical protein
MAIDTLGEYAALHARAVCTLARLKGLDLDAMPRGLRERLRLYRDDLESLVAVTAPDAAPLLEAAFKHLGRRGSIDELWALVRRR